MPTHRLLRGSGDFKGLDKRTSDLTRGIEYATDMKNATYRDSGAINKRKGFHKHERRTGSGSYGMITYKSVSAIGAVTDELLMVDTELNKLVESNITLVYDGSDDIYYSVIFDETTSSFKFQILLSSRGLCVDKDLSGVTLDQLATFIDAVELPDVLYEDGETVRYPAHSPLSPFNMTIPTVVPDIGGYASEWMELTLNKQLVAGGGESNDISIKYWAAVTKGDTSLSQTFAGYKRDSNEYLKSDDLENVTFAQMHDVLYISNGIDNLMKYDGTNVYRAGLPNPVITSVADSGDAGDPDGTYYYKVIFEFEDAKGNFTESTQIVSDAVTVATNKIDIRIPFIQPGEEFNLNNHSNKLKIKVYRNAAGGGLAGNFYEIASDAVTSFTSGPNSTYGTGVVNDSSIAWVEIEDNTDDEDLIVNALLAPEIKRRDPPPKGRYITTFKDCLVVSGQRENVNNLQYSLPFNAATLVTGCESFPDDDNGKIIESSFGDKITAIATLRDVLYVFHTNSVHTLTGDVTDMEATDPTTIDLLTKEGSVGCSSQNSIQELRGELLFLSESGLYGINTSGGLREVSSKVKSLFNTTDRLGARPDLSKKRSVGFNWTDQNLYVLHMPTERVDDGDSTAYYAKCTTSDSVLVAYDYFRDAWLQWTNLDYSGGVALYEDKIFFNSRYIDSGLTIASELSSMSSSGSTHDYNDHDQAIPFEYDTNWESLGEPTVPKKYLRLKVYSNDTDGTFESTGFQLGIALQKNYNIQDLGTMTFDFDSGAQGGWGVAPWGEFGWGNSLNRHIQSKLPTGKNKALKLRFKNEEYNTNVLITNYELEVVAPYQTEMKE